MMQVFKNADFVKRDYKNTNVVFAVANSLPQAQAEKWIEAPSDDYYFDEYGNLYFHLNVTHLYTQDGVRFFGYL
jgi:hypothetical protein